MAFALQPSIPAILVVCFLLSSVPALPTYQGTPHCDAAKRDGEDQSEKNAANRDDKKTVWWSTSSGMRTDAAEKTFRLTGPFPAFALEFLLVAFDLASLIIVVLAVKARIDRRYPRGRLARIPRVPRASDADPKAQRGEGRTVESRGRSETRREGVAGRGHWMGE